MMTSRVVLTGFLILLQLVWFLVLFFQLTKYASWIDKGLVVCSVFVELYILSLIHI